MRPVILRTLTGAGAKSSWAPVDYTQLSANIALYGVPSSGASLTYTVQYTPGGVQDPLKATISRAATVATMILPSHGLSVGDSLSVAQGGVPFDGTFDVATVVDANTLTYTVLNSGSVQTQSDVLVLPMPVFTVTGLVGQAARAVGSITNPAGAVRIIMASWVSGSVDLYLIQGVAR